MEERERLYQRTSDGRFLVEMWLLALVRYDTFAVQQLLEYPLSGLSEDLGIIIPLLREIGDSWITSCVPALIDLERDGRWPHAVERLPLLQELLQDLMQELTD